MNTRGFLSLAVLALLSGLLAVSCATTGVPERPTENSVSLTVNRTAVEVGQSVELSVRVATPEGEEPDITWSTSGGEISLLPVIGEADLLAPAEPGPVTVTAQVALLSETVTREVTIEVLPEGALKRTADVLIAVDTNTLRDVWVNEDYPAENFTPPLKVKGTFRFNPETAEASAGGSWPSYVMYDDGTHGDLVANDGVWSLLMRFEKTDAKVHFAFDDASPYRVTFESGVTWRMKTAWIDLDEFPDDNSDPAFIPDGDKTVAWTADMAEEGGIYDPAE
jgi:hypothetical protein